MRPAETDAPGTFLPEWVTEAPGQPGEDESRPRQARAIRQGAPSDPRAPPFPAGGRPLRLFHFKNGDWEEADDDEDE